MKRSEMLKVIEGAIDSACGNDGEQRLYPDDSYLAFRILTKIEESGMMPPHCEIAERKRYEKFKGPGYYSDGNNWEPEDV